MTGTIGAPGGRTDASLALAGAGPEDLRVTTHDPTFGELVKQARQAAGLTQEGLAARAGLSARVISDLERNVSHMPRSGTVQLLLGALPLSTLERELLRQAATDPPTRQLRARAVPSPARLVGRARERALLEAHLEGHSTPLLMVSGEPGIGKTRLLQEAATLAASAGLHVLRGAPPPVGQETTYDPIAAALRDDLQRRSPVHLRRDLHGCGWLVRMLPELASGPIDALPPLPPGPDQTVALTARAVLRYLRNVGSPAGTLLVLDDVHQADLTALHVLARLVQSAADVPLRIVAAQRETEARHAHGLSSVVARLAQEQLVRHVPLDPLTPNEAADLLTQLLPDTLTPSADWRQRVLAQAGGLPFYVVAWAQELRVNPQHAASDEVPWAVRQSIRYRIDALAPSVRPVLEAVAVAGGEATSTLLAALAGGPEHELVEALEAACRERLLQEQGGVYRLVRGAVRRVLETDLSHARRLLLIRRLAALTRTAPSRRPARDALTAGSLERASELEEREYHLAVLRRHQRFRIVSGPAESKR
jgi:transcriptional regulator with XRE-family HTH domain